MAARKKNSKIDTNLSFRGIKESTLLAFVGISLFLILSLFSYSPNDPAWSHSISSMLESQVLNLGGHFGAHFADISFYLFGLVAYFIPVFIVFLGWFIYQQMSKKLDHNKLLVTLRAVGFLLTIISACAISTMHFSAPEIDLPSNIGQYHHPDHKCLYLKLSFAEHLSQSQCQCQFFLIQRFQYRQDPLP